MKNTRDRWRLKVLNQALKDSIRAGIPVHLVVNGKSWCQEGFPSNPYKNTTVWVPCSSSSKGRLTIEPSMIKKDGSVVILGDFNLNSYEIQVI